jgi:hypothetical protein
MTPEIQRTSRMPSASSRAVPIAFSPGLDARESARCESGAFISKESSMTGLFNRIFNELVSRNASRKSGRGLRRARSLRRAINACRVEGLEHRTMLSVVPIANPNGPYAFNEGSGITISGAGSSDPDGSIVTYRWDLDYDGVTFTNDAVIPASVSPDGSFFFFSTDNFNTRTIALKVIDNNNDVSAIATTTLTVSNVAPTVTASGNSAVDEGATYTINFAASGEVGEDTISGWTVNWGDGVTTNHAGNATSADHVFDGPGNYTITVTATDEDGTYSDTHDVAVANVAPTLSVTGDDSIAEGSAYTITSPRPIPAMTRSRPGTSTGVMAIPRSAWLATPRRRCTPTPTTAATPSPSPRRMKMEIMTGPKRCR